MKIKSITPNSEILIELGRRLASVRKQRGYTQTRLAEEAGIGVATLRRIEGGQDSQMESWLKLMKPLDLLSALDLFMPEHFKSPMSEVRQTQKR